MVNKMKYKIKYSKENTKSTLITSVFIFFVFFTNLTFGSSLVEVTNLNIGHATCTEGGTQIDSGHDNGDGGESADDGILGPGEIDQTSFSCNSNQLLIDPPTPFSCTTTTTVNTGLDNGDGTGSIAGNGILEAGEIDNQFQLCDGSEGIQGTAGVQGPQGLTGPSGSQGLQGPIGLTGPQGLQGPTGPVGDTGEAGDNGLDGSNGADALNRRIFATNILNPPQCNGTSGLGIQSCVDSNSDGLCDGPFFQVGIVCEGAQGPQGPQGPASMGTPQIPYTLTSTSTCPGFNYCPFTFISCFPTSSNRMISASCGDAGSDNVRVVFSGWIGDQYRCGVRNLGESGAVITLNIRCLPIN